MARDVALERAWRRRMGQYERSGLTIREFCAQQGLVTHQFSWWRSELKRRAAKSKSTGDAVRVSKPGPKKNGERTTAATAHSFVPVQIAPSPPTSAHVEIVLDRPPRIKVAPGFDADLLRAVVGVLESR